MNTLSKKSKKIIHYTLVIGGSFYFGTFIYSSLLRLNDNEIAISSTKEMRPILQQYKNDIILKSDSKHIIITNSEVQKWFKPYIRSYTGQEDLRIDDSLIASHLEDLAPRLNIPPVNAKLQFKNNRAQEFVPSSRGRNLNIGATSALITSAIISNKSSISLAFDIIEPEISLEKINDLGITTLLGRGESDYGKSSPARIHNIKLGISKFNGTMLEPNEEFSFNKLLGEVEEKDGYQAELVIKSGQLVKEYGGGLCQVATTVFRGAIMSGLQILERKPHSFPVQYYSPQGFDATIYPGVVDLRFKNNTASHALIQAKLTGSKLTVEIYGSNSDKKISLDGPHQYAKQPTGAMKAYFIRKISKDGIILSEERFDSNYKAPPPSPLERNPLE